MTSPKTPTIKTAPASVADPARVRIGGGLRRAVAPSLPAAPPATIRDSGRVRVGGGLRRI